MAMTATTTRRRSPTARARPGLGLGFRDPFRGGVVAEEDIELQWTVAEVHRKDRLRAWIAESTARRARHAACCCFARRRSCCAGATSSSTPERAHGRTTHAPRRRPPRHAGRRARLTSRTASRRTPPRGTATRTSRARSCGPGRARLLWRRGARRMGRRRPRLPRARGDPRGDRGRRRCDVDDRQRQQLPGLLDPHGVGQRGAEGALAQAARARRDARRVLPHRAARRLAGRWLEDDGTRQRPATTRSSTAPSSSSPAARTATSRS